MIKSFVTINYVAGTSARVATHELHPAGCLTDAFNSFWNSYYDCGNYYNFATSDPLKPSQFISIAKSTIVDIIIEEIQ